MIGYSKAAELTAKNPKRWVKPGGSAGGNQFVSWWYEDIENYQVTLCDMYRFMSIEVLALKEADTIALISPYSFYRLYTVLQENNLWDELKDKYLEFLQMTISKATPAAAEELMAIYNDYTGKVGTPVTGVKAAPSLWDDSMAVTFPAHPSNSTGEIHVSKLLKVKASKLPGPDFTMPIFEASSWPVEVLQHIPRLDESDIEHYVYPVDAAYWFCYGIRMNKPVFLSGVKGCGKSTLPKKVAADLNWPFLRKQMAKDMDSSEFFGSWTSKDGSTHFIPGDLPQAAAAGMMFLIDEISNAPNELHPALHQCLEKNGKIYLNSKAGDIHEKIVIPHECFRAIASDNTRGQGDTRGAYAGTDVMNSATMDRFRVMIVMDYMERKQELMVLKNTVPGATDLLCEKVLDVAAKVRASYQAGDLSETLSMRPLIEWIEKCVFTRDVMKSLEVTMLNKIDSDSERSQVISFVQAVFGSLLKAK